MFILLHSSKTMRPPAGSGKVLRPPQLLDQAIELNAYLKTLSPAQLQQAMHISAALAAKTHQLIRLWNAQPANQSLALDAFVGDIYSGLQASALSAADRDYADQTLGILSGLYGIIRPFDGIQPYRLEMAYKFPSPQYADLYQFWGRQVADCLPAAGLIVNASSQEYSKVILPFVAAERVITPHFLTIDPKTNQPAFFAVHAKIARGAFARWLITNRTTNATDFSKFNDLGYRFSSERSSPLSPAFVCPVFGGIGLSMRLGPSSHSN